MWPSESVSKVLSKKIVLLVKYTAELFRAVWHSLTGGYCLPGKVTQMVAIQGLTR